MPTRSLASMPTVSSSSGLLLLFAATVTSSASQATTSSSVTEGSPAPTPLPTQPKIPARDDQHYPQEEQQEAAANPPPKLTKFVNASSAVLMLPDDASTEVTASVNEILRAQGTNWTLVGVLPKGAPATSQQPVPLPPCVVVERVFERWSLLVYLGEDGKEILRLRSSVGDIRTPHQPYTNYTAIDPHYFDTLGGASTDIIADWARQEAVDQEPSYRDMWKYMTPRRDYVIISTPESDMKWQMCHDGAIRRATYDVPEPDNDDGSGEGNSIYTFHPKSYATQWSTKWTGRKSGMVGHGLRVAQQSSYDAASDIGFGVQAFMNVHPTTWIRFQPRVLRQNDTHVPYQYYSVVDNYQLSKSGSCSNVTMTVTEYTAQPGEYYAQLWQQQGIWTGGYLKEVATVTVPYSERRLSAASPTLISQGLSVLLLKYNGNYGTGNYFGGSCNYAPGEWYIPGGTGSGNGCFCGPFLGGFTLSTTSLQDALLTYGLTDYATKLMSHYMKYYVYDKPTEVGGADSLGPAMQIDPKFPTHAPKPEPKPTGACFANSSWPGAGRFKDQLINMESWKQIGCPVPPKTQGFTGYNATLADSLSDYGILMTMWVRMARLPGGLAWAATVEEAFYPRIEQIALLLLEWRYARQDPDQGPEPSTKGLIWGPGEHDVDDHPTFFYHVNGWAWRGIVEVGRLLADNFPNDSVATGTPNATFGRYLLQEAALFKQDIHNSLYLTVQNVTNTTTGEKTVPFWIPPVAKTNQTINSCPGGETYANFRFYGELLSSGVLPKPYQDALMTWRLSNSNTLGGMQRLGSPYNHLDDFPALNYLEAELLGDRTDVFSANVHGHLGSYNSPGTFWSSEQLDYTGDGFWRSDYGMAQVDYCTPSSLLAVQGVMWQFVHTDTDYTDDNGDADAATPKGAIWLGKAVPRRWWSGNERFGATGTMTRYGQVDVMFTPPTSATSSATSDSPSAHVAISLSKLLPWTVKNPPLLAVRVRNGAASAHGELKVTDLQGPVTVAKVDSESEVIYLRLDAPVKSETQVDISFNALFASAQL